MPSPEEKRELGQTINVVKTDIEAKIEDKLSEIKEGIKARSLSQEDIDVTLPGRGLPAGAKHPISRVMDEIVYTFERMGFNVAEGPEVELDYYNFEALNIPKDHPARDMQDTFYITDDIVLRTHTSPVQIRVVLGVDGGITATNIAEVANLGPDLIVTGSAVFDGKAPADNARRMLAAVATARG